MTVLYFAYGSNMLSSRIIKRAPSAKAVGRAALYDWCVNFSKKSKDGSGKANLFQKTGFTTWGGLYKISADEINKLDKVEKGYTRVAVNVRKDDGEIVDAETYIANDLIDDPVAFDSYKQMLISGAIEHNNIIFPKNIFIIFSNYLQDLKKRDNTALIRSESDHELLRRKSLLLLLTKWHNAHKSILPIHQQVKHLL
jgi:gamma-glutamylcyclotransferase